MINIPIVDQREETIVLPIVHESRAISPADLSSNTELGPQFTVEVIIPTPPLGPVWGTIVYIINHSLNTYVTTDFELWVGGLLFETGSGPDPINPGDTVGINDVVGSTIPGFPPAAAFIKAQGVTIWTGIWEMGYNYNVTINY